MRRALLVAAALLGLELVPRVLAACDPPEPLSRAPTGGDALFVCRRPMAVAMPGQGSDAPGWLVLRDGAGWVRGVVSLGIARTAGEIAAVWDADRVRVPLQAEFPRPGLVAAPLGFLLDHGWRWRAMLGLVSADEAFR